jgi:hypothetical protein
VQQTTTAAFEPAAQADLEAVCEHDRLGEVLRLDGILQRPADGSNAAVVVCCTRSTSRQAVT